MLCCLAVNLLLLVTSGLANLTLRRSCPNLETFQNLDLDKFSGQWYEISRSANPWEFGKCIQVRNIANEENNQTFWMIWEQIGFTNEYIRAESLATPQMGNQADLSLKFTLPESPFPIPFFILDTDYYNYYVAYTCYPHFTPQLARLGIMRFAEAAWIMSRTRELNRSTEAMLKRNLRRSGVFAGRMIEISHVGCEAYENNNVTSSIQEEMKEKKSSQ